MLVAGVIFSIQTSRKQISSFKVLSLNLHSLLTEMLVNSRLCSRTAHKIKVLDLASTTHKLSPPHVAALGEGGGLNDLWSHPGVGASRAHLGGLVPLSGQAKVGDLQGQAFHTFILYGLSQEDCRTRTGRRRFKVRKEKQLERFKQMNMPSA